MISLLGGKCEKERRDRERIHDELNRLLDAQRQVPPSWPNQGLRGNHYPMDGISRQRNDCNTMTQNINMYQMANGRPRPKSAGMSSENLRGENNDDVNYQQWEESQETRRRNSWFETESFHMGGVAPSGNTTPEFRNVHWEGVPPSSDTPRRKGFHTGGSDLIWGHNPR